MFHEQLTQTPDAHAWRRLAVALAALTASLTGCFALAYASGRLGWW
ncbi:MAG: hypothetical protein ACE5E1_08225 [Phycisphaerae bacterium]